MKDSYIRNDVTTSAYNRKSSCNGNRALWWRLKNLLKLNNYNVLNCQTRGIHGILPGGIRKFCLIDIDVCRSTVDYTRPTDDVLNSSKSESQVTDLGCQILRCVPIKKTCFFMYTNHANITKLIISLRPK